MRIVSLLPSATEILCLLGLADRLVGVTHECDWPPEVRGLPKVTRTLIPQKASSREIDSLVRERLKTEQALYSLDLPMLEQLQPDLIVTQSLCDVCAVAEAEVREAACSLPGNPAVIDLEPACLEDILACIQVVAQAAGVEERGEIEIDALRARIASVERQSAAIERRPRIVVLEWIDPPFCAGHWSPQLVRLAGGVEAIGREGERSQAITAEDIAAADPELLFIACCGYDVGRTMQDLPLLRSFPEWDRMTCVRDRRIYVVDGSAYFSRPGPRLVDSLEILAHTLHPSIHPLPSFLPPAIEVSHRIAVGGEAITADS